MKIFVICPVLRSYGNILYYILYYITYRETFQVEI